MGAVVPLITSGLTWLTSTLAGQAVLGAGVGALTNSLTNKPTEINMPEMPEQKPQNPMAVKEEAVQSSNDAAREEMRKRRMRQGFLSTIKNRGSAGEQYSGGGSGGMGGGFGGTDKKSLLGQ